MSSTTHHTVAGVRAGSTTEHARDCGGGAAFGNVNVLDVMNSTRRTRFHPKMCTESQPEPVARIQTKPGSEYIFSSRLAFFCSLLINLLLFITLLHRS